MAIRVKNLRILCPSRAPIDDFEKSLSYSGMGAMEQQPTKGFSLVLNVLRHKPS
jgi:hypothetical protein